MTTNSDGLIAAHADRQRQQCRRRDRDGLLVVAACSDTGRRRGRRAARLLLHRRRDGRTLISTALVPRLSGGSPPKPIAIAGLLVQAGAITVRMLSTSPRAWGAGRVPGCSINSITARQLVTPETCRARPCRTTAPSTESHHHRTHAGLGRTTDRSRLGGAQVGPFGLLPTEIHQVCDTNPLQDREGGRAGQDHGSHPGGSGAHVHQQPAPHPTRRDPPGPSRGHRGGHHHEPAGSWRHVRRRATPQNASTVSIGMRSTERAGRWVRQRPRRDVVPSANKRQNIHCVLAWVDAEHMTSPLSRSTSWRCRFGSPQSCPA